jgi:hypothetical protein
VPQAASLASSPAYSAIVLWRAVILPAFFLRSFRSR